MEAKKLVGWNVRKHRVARGMTLEDVAVAARTNASYVAEVERGEANIGIELLDKLAGALALKPADLFIEPELGEKPPAPLKGGRRPQRHPATRDSWHQQHQRVRELLEQDIKHAKEARGHSLEDSFFVFPLLTDGGPTLETFLFMRELDWVSPETVRAIDGLLKASGRLPGRPIAKKAEPTTPSEPLSGWHRQRQLVRQLLEHDMDLVRVDVGGGMTIGPDLDFSMLHSMFASDFGPTPETLQHCRNQDWIRPETAQAIEELLRMDSVGPRRPDAKAFGAQAQSPTRERKTQKRRNPKPITRGKSPH